jgi:gamma-glutamyl-gamma-aminobutyrate hydrolase PuuD
MARKLRVAVPRWPREDDPQPTRSQQNYLDEIVGLGLAAVDLTDVSTGLRGCAGLLLTGGVDVNPGLYGEAPGPRTDEPNRARDDFELRLLREALAADLPVLAICRGHQLLNVCLGGRLLQHIEGDPHRWLDDEPATSNWHEVDVAVGSRLGGIYGPGRLLVNSRHHQGVTADRLAPGLRCTAVSHDGFVEGVESLVHRWVIGVQWHPERQEESTPQFNATSARLWQAFAGAVRSPQA